MIQQIETVIRNAWPRIGIPGPVPRRFHFFALAYPDGMPNSKICQYWVAQGQSQPCGVVKISKHAEQARRLERQHQQLTLLSQDERLDFMRESFPKPLALFTHGTQTVQVETFLQGTVLSSIFKRKWNWWSQADQQREDGFRRVVRWVTDFHIQTRQLVRLDPRLFGRMVGNYFSSPLVQSPSAPAVVSAFVAQTQKRWQKLYGREWPCVFFHNSLSPKNIVVRQDGIGIYDWEEAATFGPPLVDLLHLYVRYLGILYGWKLDRAFAECFKQPQIHNFASALNIYLDAVGVPQEGIEVLAATYLIARYVTVRTYRDQLIAAMEQFDALHDCFGLPPQQRMMGARRGPSAPPSGRRSHRDRHPGNRQRPPRRGPGTGRPPRHAHAGGPPGLSARRTGGRPHAPAHTVPLTQTGAPEHQGTSAPEHPSTQAPEESQPVERSVISQEQISEPPPEQSAPPPDVREEPTETKDNVKDSAEERKRVSAQENEKKDIKEQTRESIQGE